VQRPSTSELLRSRAEGLQKEIKKPDMRLRERTRPRAPFAVRNDLNYPEEARREEIKQSAKKGGDDRKLERENHYPVVSWKRDAIPSATSGTQENRRPRLTFGGWYSGAMHRRRERNGHLLSRRERKQNREMENRKSNESRECPGQRKSGRRSITATGRTRDEKTIRKGSNEGLR